jgi:hypothetical protein
MQPVPIGPEELRDHWIELEGTQAPKVPIVLLRKLYAQQVSEQALGGLPDWVLAELNCILAEHRRLKATKHVDAVRRELSIGTRLVREWNGKTISVEVREDGYLYADELYGSLSEIARAITGARWSGPRFFGIQRRG